MFPISPFPASDTLRLLLKREQDNEFIDLLSASLQGAPASRRNIVSGWRLYLRWVRDEGRGVLNADQAQAEAYVEWLKVHYEAPATLNNRLVQVRKLYRLLSDGGMYQGNAFEQTHGQVNPADRRRPVYTHQEIDRLLAHGNLEEKLLVLLGTEMGLTGPEVLKVRFEDFLNDGQELHLPGRSTVIPCLTELRMTLLELRQQRGEQPLFEVKLLGRVFNLEDTSALRAAVFALCKKANVPYKAWMALRNYAGIKMLYETGDGRLTAARLGIGGRQALNPTVRLVKKIEGE